MESSAMNGHGQEELAKCPCLSDRPKPRREPDIKMLSIETVVAMSQAGGHCAFAVYLLNGEKTRAHGRFT
jgi:hypothetical protein